MLKHISRPFGRLFNIGFSMHMIAYSLYEIGAIQFGEFKLKSGQMSPVYINLRKIISYPHLLRTIADMMWDKTRACDFNLICGVPYTALPIATCMSLKHDLPMLMRRKEKKDYGTRQIIEGVYHPQETCLIIEDVITTGSSVLETTEKLEECGLIVKDIVALIDREQGGRENIEKNNYRLHAIFTITTLLQELADSALINVDERTIIEEFLESKKAS